MTATRTIAEALAVAPASTEKTALDTALDTLFALPAAQVSAGAFGAIVQSDIEEKILELTEYWASQLKDHS